MVILTKSTNFICGKFLRIDLSATDNVQTPQNTSSPDYEVTANLWYDILLVIEL